MAGAGAVRYVKLSGVRRPKPRVLRQSPIRNSQSEIRNPKFEIPNPQSPMPSTHSISQAISTLTVLARAQVTREGREMLAEMRQVQRSLPARYNALPLPEFLAELTPERADWVDRDRGQVRELVDALAFWDRGSPFGVCLRRSLLRYHFLRRTGLPLGIVFAMRARRRGEAPGLAGHAWNILNGEPYHERPEDMTGFTEVYRWPQEG